MKSNYMKQKIKLSSVAVILFVLAFHKAKAQVTAQDGRTYKTVKIGNQIWMAENLSVSTYRNGDSILYKQEKGKKPKFKLNIGWQSMSKGAWCYYETEKGIDTTYGKLYNWLAVNDSRGLAPEGWHIPTSEEWKQLGEFLGGKDTAGFKLKSTKGWEENGNGTNESGFNGFPAGIRSDVGVFYGKGYSAFWWTSSRIIGMLAYYCALHYLNSTFFYKHNISNNNIVGLFGFSVRCIKD